MLEFEGIFAAARSEQLSSRERFRMMLVGSWSSRASITARSLFVSDVESSKQLSSTSTATSKAKHDMSRQNLGTKQA
jgi:hypothetical protein